MHVEDDANVRARVEELGGRHCDYTIQLPKVVPTNMITPMHVIIDEILTSLENQHNTGYVDCAAYHNIRA